MMAAQRNAGLLNRGAQGNPGGQGAPIVRVAEEPAQITLAQVGIDKNLADRARKAAATPSSETSLTPDKVQGGTNIPP